MKFCSWAVETDRVLTMTDNKRHLFVLTVFVLAAFALLWRAVHLQYYSQEMLQREADNRHLRTAVIPARRGMITDRSGEPLAVSTPVYDVWVDPLEFGFADNAVGRLSEVLDLDAVRLRALIEKKQDKRFVYVKRHVKPLVGKQVRALSLPGVNLLREHRRFYPMSEAAAHLIGITNIDGAGIEGVEKQFNDILRGISGRKKVLRDRHGDTFENVELISTSREGKRLALTIDHNIQYHAYKTLTSAVKKHDAKGGSVVLLDAQSGEVLALVNQPSFNPNTRKSSPEHRRSVALIDTFEAGSTIKPLVAAILLDGGYVSPDTEFDTGYHDVSGRKIVDFSNYGTLNLSGIITKSSNVGMSKAALLLPPEALWQRFRQLGFGQILGTGFPGEASGQLPHHMDWELRDQVGLSFGYGFSVTLMQLAHAYSVFANDGWRSPLSLVSGIKVAERVQILQPETAHAVRQMLVQAVAKGTGKRARVDGFTTAGKTGTTHKNRQGRYEENRYLSLFVGFAPASRPRLIAAVMIDEPGDQEYFGGVVAAPVFSELMQYALRRLKVPGDEFIPPVRDDGRSYMLANE